ncbi:MAG: ferrous iron transport protein A [Clostridium sp.]|uniref:FeoA family protein n=1 Tax=Clostridium sp. DSM 8431 TaxID=1761781 RepID=UPI0008F0F72B|nr:FeoA family protein [Clostridium sp. DSM 8431]MCR4943928.1 ferrous iron transport protein A [Clostridium sp.]SFU61622.1 ferrous iron transport protein A [Clostridium sp. DSM 8431]
MKLKEAEVSSLVKVIDIEAEGELRRRFFDLGIIEGTKIEVLYRSPFGDPTAYLIRGTVIAIREEDSEKISVLSFNNC